MAATTVVAACGSSVPPPLPSASGGPPPAFFPTTIQMSMANPPASLDPGDDDTPQGGEVNWLIYTGLTTYSRAAGNAGTQLIPGLATALPQISDGGRTYTVTLRKGLVFSNGKPVKASDFLYTIERDIKLPWPGAAAFITPIIKGAKAYADGTASTISGITTDDATGQITIQLTAPYGAFENVLAMPALGIIPAGTPIKNESATPPPGVGPYVMASVVPDESFELAGNPDWSRMKIPGIPAGHLNIKVRIDDSNPDAEALTVLTNNDDLLDWDETIQANLTVQIERNAASRFRLLSAGTTTYYAFMNVTEPPFNNKLVREAVVTGLDQNALSHLGSGTLQAGCFLLPPGVIGHPTGRCPYGAPGAGNLARAKALLKQSGDTGDAVTVWSPTQIPNREWMQAYTRLLNRLGLKATLKLVASARYPGEVGQARAVDPQTGFAVAGQGLPNPAEIYSATLDPSAITPTHNHNLSQVNDPTINRMLRTLAGTPTSNLSSVASRWQQLDSYVARQAYVVVLGYPKYPFLVSTRIKQTPAMISPIYGWDLSEVQVQPTS